jgi:signal transduction histidine kinase
MKPRLADLSKRYVTALRAHLKRGPRATLQPALKLGRQAAALGLGTLELARIHQQSLVTLKLRSKQDGFRKRAEKFFTAASTPIAATHRIAQQAKAHLNQLKKTLGERTGQLAASQLQLKLDTAQRKSMQGEYARSGAHHQKCLRESLKLQQHLRQLTRRVLVAQESERTKISRELQDEIAQTLLGINVRLLSLKQEARINSTGLTNELASTQRLVKDSARSVRRFAREFGRT